MKNFLLRLLINSLLADILCKKKKIERQMNNPITAIYCRLSKEDERTGESESIQNQKSMLISYAMHNDWDIFKIYADDDYSGTDSTRPEWNEMLREAKLGKFNIVLCKTQSRFSRDMTVIENYLHGKFIEWGIRFVSVVDNADTNLRGNKKARQINSLINEWYLEDLSENVRAVFKDKMLRGEYLSTYAPYGYKKDPNKRNHLIIDTQPAEIVKMIYNWHLEGYGTQRIAQMLNEMCTPNPRKQKEIDGIRRTKMYAENERGLWCTTTISDILHNQTYCGDTVQNTQRKASYKSEKRIKVPKSDWIIAQNTHEPIINRDVFAQAQRNLEMKCRAAGTGEIHLLSGKVFCYYCKKAMQKNHAEAHTGYLRCRNKYLLAANQKCPTPNVRIDYIENAVRQELQLWLDKYLVHRGISNIPILQREHTDKLRRLQDEEKQTRMQIAKINITLKNLYIDRISELISTAQFLEFNEIFLADKKKLQTKLHRTIQALDTAQHAGAEKENTEITSETFMQSREFVRSMITEFVDCIDIGRIDENGSETIIDINWNF